MASAIIQLLHQLVVRLNYKKNEFPFYYLLSAFQIKNGNKCKAPFIPLCPKFKFSTRSAVSTFVVLKTSQGIFKLTAGAGKERNNELGLSWKETGPVAQLWKEKKETENVVDEDESLKDDAFLTTTCLLWCNCHNWPTLISPNHNLSTLIGQIKA